MAVISISQPITPDLLTASFPQIIVLESDKYGTAGITQHRFRMSIARAADNLDISKFTIVTNETDKQGQFDIASSVASVLNLSPFLYDAVTFDLPITGIATFGPLLSLVDRQFFFNFYEQYYDAGVFTENFGTFGYLYYTRGWTDDTDYKWIYANWYQFNGLTNFLPFSGHHKQVVAQPTRNDSWPTIAAEPYFKIQSYYYNSGVPTLALDNVGLRNVDAWSATFYMQLFRVGLSDQADFEKVEFVLSTAAAPGGPFTEVDRWEMEKTITVCEDDEALIMFQDRFWNWSFMSFNKKQSTTVNTMPQQAESATGRFRYNVKSSDVLTLNTDWMDDAVNEMFKDLVSTEQCFLVAADGSQEALTVVPNSLRLQTSRNEGLHQYQMQFRKSLDNFKA